MEELGYRFRRKGEPEPRFCQYYQTIKGFIGNIQTEFGLCNLENRFMNCRADPTFCNILKKYHLEGYKK